MQKLNNFILFCGLWGILSPAQVAQANPIKQVSSTPEEVPFLVADQEEDDTSDFGDRGVKRWYIQGGGATTVDDEEARSFALVGAGISQFFANGHSVNLELNGMSFFQTNDDAVGLNLALLLRWHFYRGQNWSVFVDGGAGILGTTNNVPR